MSAGENTRPAASPVDDLMNARRFTGTMDMVRSLPNYYFSRHGRCRSPLRGLYGQSGGAGKTCGRPLQSGGSRRSTASSRAETVIFCRIFDQIGMGADAREDAFAQRWDQSNW